MDMTGVYAAVDTSVKALSEDAIEALRLKGSLPNADDPKGKVCEARRVMIRELIQAGLVSSYSASATAKVQGETPYHRMKIEFTRLGWALSAAFSAKEPSQ